MGVFIPNSNILFTNKDKRVVIARQNAEAISLKLADCHTRSSFSNHTIQSCGSGAGFCCHIGSAFFVIVMLIPPKEGEASLFTAIRCLV